KFDPTNYNNDGQPLHMIAEHYITLPDIYGQLNPFAVAKVKKFLLAAKQYTQAVTVDVTITCDYAQTTMTVELEESFSWGKTWGLQWGWVDFLAKEGKVGKKARRVKVRIENNKVDSPVTILAVGFLFKPGKTKGEKRGVASTN
ncbi:MAG TPA: hypothetical protein VEA37_02475, partial [Flavobacterium sp.]|nr:hypothetical protein [Flavobacterium sp.]